jgi:acetyl-CoA carboxylase biotin carboxyl carrier protein
MAPVDEQDIACTAANLAAVCRSATEFITASPGAVRRIRLTVGDVTLEAEWADRPDAGEATGTTAAMAGDESGQRPDDEQLHYVCAELIGTFYRSPEPGSTPFAREGDHVQPGQQLAILEAMKLMLPVKADRPGTVMEVIAPDAAPVEYGERLFAIALDPPS